LQVFKFDKDWKQIVHDQIYIKYDNYSLMPCLL